MSRVPLGVAAGAVVLLAACTVNPVTGKSQLDLLGEAQELELGRQLYPGFVQESLGPLGDEGVQAAVCRAVRREGEAGILRSLLAVSLVVQGRREEAVRQAGTGARLAPGAFLAQFIAGQLLLDPDPAASLAVLDRAETVLPGIARVAYLRGQALERLRRPRDAADAYRTAMERDPQGEVGAAAAKGLEALGARGGGG